MSAIRSRLTYANVMATIAVAIALGGGAYAAKKNARKNSVGTRQLKNNAVTGVKVRNETLGLSKMIGASGTAVNLTPVTRPPGSCGRYPFAAPNVQLGDAVILAGTDAVGNAIVAAPTVSNANGLNVTVCAGTVMVSQGAGSIQLRFDTLR